MCAMVGRNSRISFHYYLAIIVVFLIININYSANMLSTKVVTIKFIHYVAIAYRFEDTL